MEPKRLVGIFLVLAVSFCVSSELWGRCGVGAGVAPGRAGGPGARPGNNRGTDGVDRPYRPPRARPRGGNDNGQGQGGENSGPKAPMPPAAEVATLDTSRFDAIADSLGLTSELAFRGFFPFPSPPPTSFLMPFLPFS